MTSGLQPTDPAATSAAQIITNAFITANWSDNLMFLLNKPLCVVTQVTSQSIPTAVGTAIAFDTTTTDTYDAHSNTVNNTRMVAQVPGWYKITGQAMFAPNGNGARQVMLAVNGTLVLPSMTGVGTSGLINLSIQCDYEVYLNAGDYVEVQAWQSSGGSLSLVTGGSAMTARWVRT